MPIKVNKQFYGCPYCKEKYERLEEAISCINRCGQRGHAEILYFLFSCTECGKEFETESSAERCENEHKEAQRQYSWKRSRKLDAAAIAEGQLKL